MEITTNGILYTGDEMNEIFDFIDVMDGNKKLFITNPDEDLLIPLTGYEVTVKVDGDHRHDGQMVDYTVTFTSPAGKKTKVYTEMCLMVGWNMYEDVLIK